MTQASMLWSRVRPHSVLLHTRAGTAGPAALVAAGTCGLAVSLSQARRLWVW